MKKILIINLRKIGDVYTTGHLVNSLTRTESNAVSLLIFKECEKAATNLKNISSLHTIDRKEIITLKTNKLFSDGFALELLFNQLQDIKNQEWDEIINYSNDSIGAYLCSYLKNSTKKVIGIHFNGQKNIESGSNWEMLFNDVLPVVKYAPLHFVDCYHKMADTSGKRDGEKVITNTNNNAIAFSRISTIRKSFGQDISAAKIIGIQLKTSDPVKDIPKKLLTEFLALLNTIPELIPVLLIAPFEDERKYASEINAKCEINIPVIEADLQMIASVLMNIDILLTPDTAIKHIADLTETPVLEISLGNAPFLKQGTYSQGSLILTDIISERNFQKEGNQKITKSKITAQDILSSLYYCFSKTKAIRPRLSNDVTLYMCSFDQLGARYSVVAGTINPQVEIHRLMSRQLVNVIYDNNESPEIYIDVTDFGQSAIANWAQNEKANLTNVMRDLLGTLRSLLLSQENRRNSKDFIVHLDKLITHSENNSFIQIPITLFKTKIESISAKTFEENAKEVEVILYDLKSDIQKALQCIKKLEETATIQRKNDLMNRAGKHADN